MSTSKFLSILLILLSTNCFADLADDLDSMDQERRIYEIESKLQDIEINQQNDNPYRFYDELHEKITKVG